MLGKGQNKTRAMGARSFRWFTADGDQGYDGWAGEGQAREGKESIRQVTRKFDRQKDSMRDAGKQNRLWSAEAAGSSTH
jgi:hypothetical protein